jgi:hypothetical protein
MPALEARAQREERVAHEAGIEACGGQPQVKDAPGRYRDHDRGQKRDRKPKAPGASGLSKRRERIDARGPSRG